MCDGITANIVPFFSILIPVYNQEKCLKRCMESVLNQTYDDFEVIIVDDASTDGSQIIEDEYEKTDRRVSVIKKQQNESLLAARIAAMEVARGRYVLFLDSDDYLSTDACEILFNELQKDPVDVLGFSFCFEPDKTERPGIRELNEEVYRQIISGDLPHNAADKCYSLEIIKKALRRIEPFYCNMTEDEFFTAVFLYYAQSYRMIDKALYHYVLQDGMSTARSMSEESLERTIESIVHKSVNLKRFFSDESPELIPYAEMGDKEDVAHLAGTVRILRQPLLHRRKLLGIIDNRFSTSYVEEFEKYLDSIMARNGILEERSSFLEELEQGGFKKKAAYAFESSMLGLKKHLLKTSGQQGSVKYVENSLTEEKEDEKTGSRHTESKPNEEPFFSILIPVYNQEQCLERCLESVLDQTYDDFEVIIVDDASTDGSLKIEDEYEKLDARVSVIKKQQNESLLAARITAMKAAHGKYVLFLDSDDYLSLEACSILHSELEREPVDVLGFSFCFEPSKTIKTPINELNKETYYNILSGELPHTVWNKCYSGKLITVTLKKVESFYCNYSEDVYFTAVFLYYAESYRSVDEVLYHYVVQDGMSTSRTMSVETLTKNIESLQRERNHLFRFFADESPDLITYAEKGDRKNIETLAKMCMQLDQPVFHRVRQLGMIDEKYGTGYLTSFESEVDRIMERNWLLEERNSFLEELENGGFRRKVIYALESGISGLKRRVKKA